MTGATFHDHTCPVQVLLSAAIGIVRCERSPHPDDQHEYTLRDFAYPGSETRIVWWEQDRRCFTGDWVECPVQPCVLPANHRGEHAP